jgi:hypothetical protein
MAVLSSKEIYKKNKALTSPSMSMFQLHSRLNSYRSFKRLGKIFMTMLNSKNGKQNYIIRMNSRVQKVPKRRLGKICCNVKNKKKMCQSCQGAIMVILPHFFLFLCTYQFSITKYLIMFYNHW